MKHSINGPAPDMTTEEKRNAAELLYRACFNIARVSSDLSQGMAAQICFAVKQSLYTQADHDVEPKLQALIKHRLGSAPSLRAWLVERGYPAHLNDAATFQKVQATRLRWMKALMKELNPAQESRHEQTGNRTNVRNARRLPRKTARDRRVSRW